VPGSAAGDVVAPEAGGEAAPAERLADDVAGGADDEGSHLCLVRVV